MLAVVFFSRKVLGKPIDLTVDKRDMQIVQKSIFASHLALVAGLCLSIFAMALQNLTVVNEIRRLRFENGEMTQKELAGMEGVTRQTIVAIENAKYSPTLE